MQNLVILSDLNTSRDPLLVKRIKELLGNNSFKLGYIPSRTDKERKYFDAAKEYFDSLGVTEILYFDVDEEYEELKVAQLSSCDGIYLSGGNTFYFLQKLKERKLTFLLKELAENGKLLMGVSAGGILMSKSIKIAEYIDENEIQSKELDSLNLVDFEFMPHWQTQTLRLQELLDYSLNQESSIYTINDGSGMIIEGSRIDYFGEVYEIRKGEIKRRTGKTNK